MTAKAPAMGNQPEEKRNHREQHQRDRQAHHREVSEGGKAVREAADALVARRPRHAGEQQRPAAVEVERTEGDHQRANAGVVDQRRIQQPAQQSQQQRQRNSHRHRPPGLHHHPQRDGAQADGRAEGDIDPAADNHKRERQRHNADADEVAGAEQQHVDVEHARVEGTKEQDLKHQ